MEQLAFAGVLPTGKHIKPTAIPSSAEVATAEKGEFLPYLSNFIYPTFSRIIQHRAEGQGIRFYDNMLGTDADLASFFRDLSDDLLHYPYTITPAQIPQGEEHARFYDWALRQIPSRQNFIRHLLDSYARGFSVFEKMYAVMDRGEWQGAVYLAEVLDKPQRWFCFDRDRNLRFLTPVSLLPGEMLPQDKFLVATFGTNSNPWGEALLDLCYWPWYLKHHALKNQAIFMEKWASPTPKVEYEWSSNEKTNKENLVKALEVLQSVQHDTAVAFPKGMAVSLMESLRNGTVSFEGYVNQLTEMESRIVTGQLLTSMGAQGGSHALGKVHEKQAANKVEMLGMYASAFVNRYIGRDLIDRNYGPQDGYPTYKILAKDPVARQADASLEQQLTSNGHMLSRSWSDEVFGVVPPRDAADLLVPSLISKPGQMLPVNPQLAEPDGESSKGRAFVAFASSALHQKAKGKAAATRTRLDGIGRDAVAKAKPAIRNATKSLASIARGKKTAASIKRVHIYKGLKGIDVKNMGQVMQRMLGDDAAS